MSIGNESTLSAAKNTEPMCNIGSMNHMLPQTSDGRQKCTQLSSAEYRRLIVDLQTRLNKRDTLIKSFQARQEKLSRRCRVQRKLIDYLREQNTSQSQQIAALEYTPVHASAQAVSAEQIREQRRVQSLDGALSRILGVEIPEKTSVPGDEIARSQLDEIDLEEFQPIVEHETSNLLSQLNATLTSAAHLTVAGCKLVKKFASELMVWIAGLPWRELKRRVVLICDGAHSRCRTFAASLRTREAKQ